MEDLFDIWMNNELCNDSDDQDDEIDTIASIKEEFYAEVDNVSQNKVHSDFLKLINGLISNNDWVSIYRWYNTHKPLQVSELWNSAACLNSLSFGLSLYRRSLPPKKKRSAAENKIYVQLGDDIEEMLKRALELAPDERSSKLSLANHYYFEYTGLESRFNERQYNAAIELYRGFSSLNKQNYKVCWRILHLQHKYYEHDKKKDVSAWFSLVDKMRELIEYYSTLEDQMQKSYLAYVSLCRFNFVKIIETNILGDVLRRMIKSYYEGENVPWLKEISPYLTLCHNYIVELEQRYPVDEYSKSVHQKRGLNYMHIQYRKAMLYTKTYEVINLDKNTLAKKEKARKYLLDSKEILEKNLIEQAKKLSKRSIGFAFPWYAHSVLGETLYFLGDMHGAIKVLLSVPAQFSTFQKQCLVTLKELLILNGDYTEHLNFSQHNTHAIVKIKLTNEIRAQIDSIWQVNDKTKSFYKKMFEQQTIGLVDLSDYFAFVYNRAICDKATSIVIENIRRFLYNNVHYKPEYDNELAADDRIYAAYVHLKRHCTMKQRDTKLWKWLQIQEFLLNVFEKEVIQELLSNNQGNISM